MGCMVEFNATSLSPAAASAADLARYRGFASSALPQLSALWHQAHQLAHTGDDNERSRVFTRSFYPATRFAAGAARVPPEMRRRNYTERMRTRPCSTFIGSTHCGIELDEWIMLSAFVKPSHVILELGARYGTTSCVLANATANSGNVVSVEPDGSAHEALLFNRDANRCNFAVVHGLVARAGERRRVDPWYNSGYGRKTIRAAAADLAADTLSFREIEERIGTRFNAALVDCEGCIEESVLRTGLIDQLSLLLLESDGNAPYPAIYTELRRLGFRRVWRSHDTQDPRAAWSAAIEHSAWQREADAAPASGNEFCWAAKRRHGYSDRQLNCFDEEDGTASAFAGRTPQPLLMHPRSQQKTGPAAHLPHLRPRNSARRT